MAATITASEGGTIIFPEQQDEKYKVPFVAGDLPEEEYRLICAILKEQQGFILDGYKDLCVKRRIAARIRAVAETDPARYVEFLATSTVEQENLLAALSVHVSHFFRNPSTYRVLEKKVLPELAARTNRLGGKLRIWSLACANGEEPYSLALLCRKLLSDMDRISIIGTDLSPAAIQRAKQGCYDASRLQEVAEEDLQRFFLPSGGQYCLVDEVKRLVRFFRHDILSDQPFYRADLILCRNLLIYFSRAQQHQVLRMLAAALPPGGYLVLGRAETMVSCCRDLFSCIDPAERIYRRLEKDEQVLPFSPTRWLQDI